MHSPAAGTLIALPLAALLVACGDSTGPSGGESAAAVAIGMAHICQIQGTTTTCWGENNVGQLGSGNTASASGRVTVTGGHHFVTIAAGPDHTCAVDDDGLAWCWGSDLSGELGTGTLQDSSCGGIPCQPQPVPVATSTRFTALAAGLSFTCGLSVDGDVRCWGLNDEGQLGTVATTTTCESVRCSRTPVVAAGGTHFSRITAGKSHACALTPDGQAWCWGYDASDDAARHRGEPASPAPAPVGDQHFTAIAAGGFHTCTLDADGAAWCWGVDALGAGDSILLTADPVRVGGGHIFRQIASGRLTSCGVDTNGAGFCWGANIDGAIGAGPAGDASYYAPEPVSGGLHFSSLAGGASNNCGTTDSGTLMCWGRGDEGQLLNGHQDSGVPVAISSE